MSTIIGELSLHYEGYGFVAPTQSGHPDVFIPARLMGDAMHGDLVEVTVRKNAKGLMEGSIKAIVQRRLKQMVGRLNIRQANGLFCRKIRGLDTRCVLSLLPEGCSMV